MKLSDVEVFTHNGLSDVVPTSLFCNEYIEVELMHPSLNYTLLDVSCIMGCKY